MEPGATIRKTKTTALVLFAALLQSPSAAEPIQFDKAMPLTGVEGRIDHMTADVTGGRLFVAVLGNKTVEVIDWNAGQKLKAIGDLAEPQGVLYVADNNRLYVATGGDGYLRTFDAASFRLFRAVKLGDDADNVRFEPGPRLVWVGYGGGRLGALDLVGNQVADIKVDHHRESFQLEREGNRIFVNLPGSKKVAVIDRAQKQTIAKWSTGFTLANFPMALDEKSKRLFVACRVPARVFVFDLDTGRIVARINTVGDTDDLFYDAARQRLYAIGGEGAVAVYGRSDSDNYHQIGRVATAPGARTGLFVPETDRLYCGSAPRITARGDSCV
jgi:DNA-binding beta-propeller fold protein YncE